MVRKINDLSDKHNIIVRGSQSGAFAASGHRESVVARAITFKRKLSNLAMEHEAALMERQGAHDRILAEKREELKKAELSHGAFS